MDARDRWQRMSGRLFVLLGLEQIRAQQAQVHEPSVGDVIGRSPLRNSADRNPAKPGNFGCSTKRIDYLICVHAQYLRRLRFIVQAI